MFTFLKVQCLIDFPITKRESGTFVLLLDLQKDHQRRSWLFFQRCSQSYKVSSTNLFAGFLNVHRINQTRFLHKNPK